jgi:hypothetical protein
MSIGLSRVGVSGPLSARSRLIPPFCFAPTEKPTIALSRPRCTSSIGLCRRSSGSYRHESSFSDTDRHSLEVGIIEVAHHLLRLAVAGAAGPGVSRSRSATRSGPALLLSRSMQRRH